MNSDFLDQPNSPTQATESTNAETYFWRVTEGNDHEYNNYDDAVKEAREIALKSIIDFSFEEQKPTEVHKYSFTDGMCGIWFDVNPLEVSLQIAKLTIEIHKILSVQWDLSSDEIVKLNELKKQLKEIIEL